MQTREFAMRLILAGLLTTTASAWAASTTAGTSDPSSTGTSATGTTNSQTPGQFIDDTTLTTKVKAALLADKAVSGLSIQVTTTQGVVVLTGDVASDTERKHAGDLASSVQGVKAVKNELKIKS